jgi:iron complex transport system permease protein
MEALTSNHQPLVKRALTVSVLLSALLVTRALLGLSMGSSGFSLKQVLAVLSSHADADPTLADTMWRILLPRVVLAALVGAALSLGGQVFQALLRNSLADPYILGISGGAAVGAIIGILLGLARFPGVSLFAFMGSMATLLLVLLI